jgi:hypothetical protein
MKLDEQWDLALPQAGFEIFTVVPVDAGVAPLGLVDMFNSSGAIVEKGFIASDIYRLKVRGAGRFTVWSKRTPLKVTAHSIDSQYSGGTDLPFSYVSESSWLEFYLDGNDKEVVDIVMGNE